MMRLSTRARYGLRMMVELARLLEAEKLVHLGRIAEITGLSESYLAQLAMLLKNGGLLIGVSGKGGGYQLAKSPDRIKISQIVEAVSGSLCLAECVNNPDICLNSSFCEARIVWVILSGSMAETLEKYTLADLIDKGRLKNVISEYAHLPLLYPDRVMAETVDAAVHGCPAETEGNQED
jgi:Rrf2 family protein